MKGSHAENIASKLAELKAAGGFGRKALGAFGGLLDKGPDLALYRVNPLSFAASKGLDEDECVDLFIHAAKLGIFRMEWHLVCQGCSKVMGDFRRLRDVHTEMYCDVCERDRESGLDEWIEVAFTVHPRVRRIAHHQPARLPADRFFFEHVLCRNVVTDDGVVYAERAHASPHVVRRLAPHKTLRFRMSLEPGVLGGTIRASYRVEGKPGAGHRLSWTVGVEREKLGGVLAPGPLEGEVRNAGRKTALVALANIRGSRQFRRDSLFTGRHLLNHASYRRLFTGNAVEGVGGLGVKDITLLFTDLKGSTELYQKVGDLKAYDLVRRHFEHLGRAVHANRGAIVKTIGDAVMASFGRPSDAARAAREMLAAIARFNAEHAEEPLALKVGVHRGRAIVVTQNGRLDYFGQTVNIAARVQSAARAGEICASDEVMRDADAAELLRGARAEEVTLRGYRDATLLYRYA